MIEKTGCFFRVVILTSCCLVHIRFGGEGVEAAAAAAAVSRRRTRAEYNRVSAYIIIQCVRASDKDGINRRRHFFI